MYSQHEEETHIIAATAHCQNRRFLDVGAWDGKTFSNTLALVERGWEGILIEPSPESFLALLKLHGTNPKITLIHAALGFERCMAKFWNTPDAVSTLNEKNYLDWKEHASFSGCFYVPIITLTELFNQFGGPFDFVSIDAEGISVDLFACLLQSGCLPKCICVEHDGRAIEVLQWAQSKGYKAIYTNGENVVLSL